MLQYLKQSTFKANDVFMNAISLLKSHYFSIAGLCFLLFITSSLSSYLVFRLADASGDVVKGLLCFVFVTLFFDTEYVLILRVLLLAIGVERASVRDYISSAIQFVIFLMGFILFSYLLGIVYLLSTVISFPLVYLGADMETFSMEINLLL